MSDRVCGQTKKEAGFWLDRLDGHEELAAMIGKNKGKVTPSYQVVARLLAKNWRVPAAFANILLGRYVGTQDGVPVKGIPQKGPYCLETSRARLHHFFFDSGLALARHNPELRDKISKIGQCSSKGLAFLSSKHRKSHPVYRKLFAQWVLQNNQDDPDKFFKPDLSAFVDQVYQDCAAEISNNTHQDKP